MDIWGNILKEATKVGHKRQERKSQKLKHQNYVLGKLLLKARFTEFGVANNFKSILQAPNLPEQFKESVPITDYKTFHQDWLHRALNGKRNIVWPGQTNFYALSSGTTNSPSKRIPVTDSMLKQFQKTTVKLIVGLHNLDLSSAFYESSVLIIGGSTELTKLNGYYEGDLSGILAKNKSFVLSKFTKPGRRISKIKNWNDKIDAIVEKADKWDVGIVAGVPSWIVLMLERIIEKYGAETIHDVWPNFSLYSHGGIFLEPYRERLNKLFSKPVYFQNTYLASEGYFAYQQDVFSQGMALLVNDGIYFEFVEEKYFSRLNDGEFEGIPTLDIDQVEENVPYALIISTCSGLWRYCIGDVIQFLDIEEKRIEIVGRISFTLSAMGEHLSDGNMQDAVKYASHVLGVNVEEFTAHISDDITHHCWYIGLSDGETADSEEFVKLIDEKLNELNDDYASQRKYTLGDPEGHVMSINRFHDFMKSIGKFGAQNKFPRVMKEEQAKKWRSYLDLPVKD